MNEVETPYIKPKKIHPILTRLESAGIRNAEQMLEAGSTGEDRARISRRARRLLRRTLLGC